jgi:hypothetical protein
MAGIYKSSGKHVNPAAGLSILTGLAGAACSLLLWLFAYRPETSFFGSWGREIAANGLLAEQLRVLAVTLGAIAIASSVMASFGVRGRWTTAAGVTLGAIGLSYPVLSWLNVATANLGPQIG